MEVFENITDFFVKLSMLFIGLLAVNHLFYLRFFRKIVPDMQSSSTVMAIAVFLMACLPQLKVPYLTLTLLSLELAIIWVYFLVSYAQALERNPDIIHRQSDQLYFGCWVAATSMLAILLDQIQPLLHGAILLLLFTSVVAWLGNLIFILLKLYRYLFYKMSDFVVFDYQMFAVSTMILLILAYELFSDLISQYYYAVFAGLAIIFYMTAFIAAISRAWHQRDGKRLVLNHHDVLLYSFLALLGYYCIESSLLADVWLKGIWWLTIAMFLLVDGQRLWGFVQQRPLASFKMPGLIYHRDYWLHLFSLSCLYWFAFSYYYQYSSNSYFVYFIVLLMPYFLLIFMLYQLATNFKSVLSHAR